MINSVIAGLFLLHLELSYLLLMRQPLFVFYSAPAELASSDSAFATPVALLLFYPKVAMLHPLHSPRSRGGTPVPLFPLQNYLRSCGAR